MTEFGLVPEAKRLIIEYLLEHQEGATMWELRTLMVLHRSTSPALADVVRFAAEELFEDGEIVNAADRVTPNKEGRAFREPAYRLSIEKWVEAVA